MSSRTKEFAYSNFGQRHFENGTLEEEEKKIGESAMLDQKKAVSVEATVVVAASDVAQ